MNLAPNCPINLDVLMQTRMLLVAGSGGGKSYALRKLLEETAPKVQQFVIDPEGEFASLREAHDYIYVAAKEGDVTASPKTAGVLAHRLLELGTSAILDLYDLRPDERQRFVKHFFDALVNSPRSLWHPVMVVLDEAHMFCPQNGSAEAMQSVIDVASRGRKKGLALVLATQRISKLHKDTAAEMQNKMLGLTTLDVDRRRVAEELGMTVKEAVQPLRQLDRGEFFVFGPALTRDVTKIKVGKVKTTHASGTGNMARSAPAPSAGVKKMLAKLTDLDAAAVKEARTLEEFRTENSALKSALRKFQTEAGKPMPTELEIQRRVEAGIKAGKQEAFDSGFLGGQVEAEKQFKPIYDEMARTIKKCLTAADSIRSETMMLPAFPIAVIELTPERRMRALERSVGLKTPTKRMDPQQRAHRISGGVLGNGPIAAHMIAAELPLERLGDEAPQLKAGAQRMLRELIIQQPDGYTRAQLGTLAGMASKSGTFTSYLSTLRMAGLIEERDGKLFASAAGVDMFPDIIGQRRSIESIRQQWRDKLKAGAQRMLDTLIESGEQGMHRANLADKVGMAAGSGTFTSYLSTLRTNGLIVEHGKRIVASDMLI